jgi:hypothetical protein
VPFGSTFISFDFGSYLRKSYFQLFKSKKRP